MKQEPIDLLVTNASEVLTLAGPARPRAGEEMSELGIVATGAVAVRKGKILEVGPSAKLSRKYRAKKKISAKGRVVSPGLVDPHTHLTFAAMRENEFEMRLRGTPYMEIARAGGGILSSVDHVRKASRKQIVDFSRGWARRMLAHGTTTVEAKSGYGLTVRDELKQLRAVRDLDRKEAIDFVPTFLGAHSVPREYKGRKKEFVELVCKEMIPAAKGLARFCDVFCEVGVFTREESRKVLEAGKEHGLVPKLHAEEFKSIGGAEMGAELGAVSADHLVAVSIRGMHAMKRSGTIAVVLPGTTFFLGGERYAPARRMVEIGVPVALATDFNPGSSMTLNLPLVMSIACTQMKLLPAEVFCAATINAAYACGVGDRAGSLEPGKKADMVIWDVDSYRKVPYIYGVNLVQAVIKDGRVVV
jgi:imidazolonepropionase